MLISFTIFHKGGHVLYQHFPEGAAAVTSLSSLEKVKPLTHGSNDDNNTQRATTESIINTWISQVYLNPTISLTDRKAVIDDAGTGTLKQVVEWQEEKSYMALAIYPDLIVRGGGGTGGKHPKDHQHAWIAALLKCMLQEFKVFVASSSLSRNRRMVPEPMDTTLFDKAFLLLFKKFKNSSALATSTHNNGNNKENTKSSKATKKGAGAGGGKEKRQWHDGKAKVTKEAMAELDFSKTNLNDNGNDNDDEGDQEERRDAVALAEARAAYLPSDADLEELEWNPTDQLEDDDETADDESSWGGSLKSLFQQVTGQKVLTKQDLQEPLKQMHNMLTSKNVATDIAQHICDNVESSLVGKKLSSMYRVKTAVRQALERAINKLLLPSSQLDVLRQVTSKRDALFGTKRPYVIVVVGINGVGKSTSLAKLAFFLKSNGCKPLLAACDTFRSGAVEQLSVHAKCLDLPIFHQGYSKDPSTVAKAAIEQASKEGNDVVLVDTAGRMQNNVPLMKALGKLTADNQPDLVVFVGEALVGNDGVDQVRMFNQAVNSHSRSQKVNAILLTKFDTVSDKVGAALTMTHVTNAPILFVGTGQKYHHLQKLSTPSVIRSLFK